jgi:hypothetical protein
VKELTWLIHHVMRRTQTYTREVQSWPLSTNGDYEDRAHNYNLYYDKKMDIKIYKTNVILYSRNFYLTTKTEDQNLVIIGL